MTTTDMAGSAGVQGTEATVTSSTTGGGDTAWDTATLSEKERNFWAALNKDEQQSDPSRRNTGNWSEEDKIELLRVITKVSGPHPSCCSKCTAVVPNSVVLNSPLLGMNVPTQVCSTCADYSYQPTLSMIAELHSTRIRRSIKDLLRNTGAATGTRGGKRAGFVEWCREHEHPLPQSFVDMLPAKRGPKKVNRKCKKRATEGELEVTAEAGGAAAAAGRAAAAQPELKLKPDSESADTSTRTWLCRFRLETYAQALDDDGYEDLVCRSCVSDVG
eukprot:COSAG01_NODE_1557_length_9928_cov_7.869977_2_plen_274_part_00